MIIFLKKFVLNNIIDFFFDYFNNILFSRTFTGFFFFKMPCFFFFSVLDLNFIFLKKKLLMSFIAQISFALRFFFSFFFVRFKMRGLGYRVKHITNNIIRFFIGTTNFFYFLAPLSIYLRARRRRLLLISMIKVY
jgi:hypothetical protein